jgi:hypothetical protein
MKPLRLVTYWLAPLLAIIPAVDAQQNAPHIGYVYPAGGRQGDTFQVKAGGQFLDGVTKAYISGAGVQATMVELDSPLTPQQLATQRDRLQELQKKERNAAVLTELAAIR